MTSIHPTLAIFRWYCQEPSYLQRCVSPTIGSSNFGEGERLVKVPENHRTSLRPLLCLAFNEWDFQLRILTDWIVLRCVCVLKVSLKEVNHLQRIEFGSETTSRWDEILKKPTADARAGSRWDCIAAPRGMLIRVIRHARVMMIMDDNGTVCRRWHIHHDHHDDDHCHDKDGLCWKRWCLRPKIIVCIQHPFLTFFLPSRAGNDSLAACATWATERWGRSVHNDPQVFWVYFRVRKREHF